MPLDKQTTQQFDIPHPSLIVARARLKSLSPYSQSKGHETPMLDKEQHDAFDKRTWREKAHVGADGRVFIPPMALKSCPTEAAAFLKLRIPGRGRSEYGKHLAAGVLCVQPLVLPIHKDDLKHEDVHCDSNGQRNSGSRVWRRFPIIDAWEGVAEFNILDRTITPDIFIQHLVAGGQFVGIGRFRPINRGWFGRFELVDLDWQDPQA
jgi:hypothetical protein